MRLMIIAVLALGACGQSPQKPEASAAEKTALNEEPA